jgi:hypothetical protein
MNVKKIGLRVIRKSSHLTNKAIHKGLTFTTKVEDKSNRIISGVDFSASTFKEIPFEKVYFNGIKYNIAPLNPALPAVGRKGMVTLLIPSLSKASFYGGTATALLIAGKLAVNLNKNLRIVETLAPGGLDGLGDFFVKNNITLQENSIELIDVSARSYNIYGYLDIHPDDIHIASAWWDALLLDKLPLPKKYIYLLQDFEPIFYANSDEYLLAENTYHSNKFIPVCNTKLMYTFMSERYMNIKKNGIWFEPAMSQNKNGYSIENIDKKRLFLYGRPSVERNLFYSGLNALNIAFNSGALDPNKWDLYMAGQDKLPNITLSSGIEIKNLGKMDVATYYKFARTIDLTISLMMAPHPNYPTLELSSIGSAVVTTKYKTKQDLSEYSKNIYMADLSIESIVDAIKDASKISYKQRIDNAKQSNIPDNWDETLKELLEEIKNKLILSNS